MSSSASERSPWPAPAAGRRLRAVPSAAPRPRSALAAVMNGTAGGGDYRLEDDYQDADESAPLHPEDLYSGRSVTLFTPVRVCVRPAAGKSPLPARVIFAVGT